MRLKPPFSYFDRPKLDKTPDPVTVFTGERVDRSSEVPDLIPYLQPGEWVKSVKKYIINIPESLTPADKVMAELTKSPNATEIGLHGPSDASLPDRNDTENTELNKYTVLFGRDSLVVAHFLADKYPALMRATLLALARCQGTRIRPMAEEKPGKIIHEYRSPDDKIAQELSESRGWQWPYYASIDSTLKFVSELSTISKLEPEFLKTEYIHSNGDRLTLWDALNKALMFIVTEQDQSELGLLEFKRENPRGIEIQIWRDSRDSLSHKDGSLSNYSKPIASLQAQTDAFDAFMNSAELFEQLSKKSSDSVLIERAADLRIRAKHIQDMVLHRFWLKDERGGFFVCGLDRDGDNNIIQLDTRTCDMGFVLSSRILENHIDDIKVKATVDVLFSDEMMNVSGVRTLSKLEKRFKPGGYHTGTVWLFINEVIAEGLDRHGYQSQAKHLRDCNKKVVNAVNSYIENARGGDDSEPGINVRSILTSTYPDTYLEENALEGLGQNNQAWTVAAIISAEYKEQTEDLLDDTVSRGNITPTEAIIPV